jgi:indole-3-glycerol phosphate synthase
LGRLLDSAERRVSHLRRDGESRPGRVADAPDFALALSAGATVALIAEIKRRSPSKGDIAPGIDAAERAAAYAQAGAAALSVLTEPNEFGGSLSDLDKAGTAGLPMLRKDFIVDRVQLVEALTHGASAVLLISKALPPSHLAELHAEASELGLDALVEVHDERELEVAAEARYPIIGVNNRDLESLVIDDGVGSRLLPLIPPGIIAVYESGIRSRQDVERAAGLGADAVLVGTALSSSADPTRGAQNLTAVLRQQRRAS